MKRYGNRYHGCRVSEFGWRNQQLIVIENQLLRIGVVATKGADILEFRSRSIQPSTSGANTSPKNPVLRIAPCHASTRSPYSMPGAPLSIPPKNRQQQK